jgi:hypothetical protein
MASKVMVPASVVVLAFAMSASVHAQSNDATLTLAYNALTRGQYRSAITYTEQYRASNPQRYDSDFIHAAGECGLNPGNPAALAEMTAVRDGYDLTPAAASQVATWLAKCRTAPVTYKPPPSQNGEGSSVSALTGPPAPAPATSAAPGAVLPKPRIHMSGMVSATSYSGDDYSHALAGSAAECAQRCMLQAPCRSMTYDTSAQICWLKRSIPPAQHGPNVISAFKIIPKS